jgi:Phosphatidylinositol-specific phospholipase C, X domain
MKSVFHHFCAALFASLFFTGCDKNENTINVNEEKPLTCNEFPELCGKTLPEISMAMTHNAFNYAGKYLVPNQDFSITRQLKDGVRGLMIDVYSGSGGSGPVVYHGLPQAGSEPLRNVLSEIKKFMDENPREVIVIIFQNGCTDEELIETMELTGLKDMAYIHNGTWPTLQEMIDQNKRLVSMLESSDGNLPQELLSAWEHTFDTPYTFTNTSDFNCNINRGGGGKKTFFLVNHWLSSAVGLPDRNRASSANNSDMLGSRVQQCSETQGRRVNFVGVDFYNLGQVLSIVDQMNGVTR